MNLFYRLFFLIGVQTASSRTPILVPTTSGLLQGVEDNGREFMHSPYLESRIHVQNNSQDLQGHSENIFT